MTGLFYRHAVCRCGDPMFDHAGGCGEGPCQGCPACPAGVYPPLAVSVAQLRRTTDLILAGHQPGMPFTVYESSMLRERRRLDAALARRPATAAPTPPPPVSRETIEALPGFRGWVRTLDVSRFGD